MNFMEYMSVSARFMFFNGQNNYTVEYSFGISKWFIFKNEENSNALYLKEDKKIKFRNVNYISAEEVLHEYLEIINK